MLSSAPPFHRSHPACIAPTEGLRGGLGGVLRTVPEDFRVEEIPIARPAGHGNFTLACVEKRGTPTFDMLLFLSKSAKVSERRIGYAGLKDSRAVTTQYVTLPKVPPERVRGVREQHFRVLSAHRHTRPIRIGHLLGNRFTIRIRGVAMGHLERARSVLETLVKMGMPNAYGQQRFGVRQDGHELGEALVCENWQSFVDRLLGQASPLEHNPLIVEARELYDAGKIRAALKTFPKRHRTEKRALSILDRGGSARQVVEDLGTGPRKIWLSAWQSYYFNAVLDARVRASSFDQLLPGDIGWLHESSAMFRSRDTAADRQLASRGTASPTGPLPGADLATPQMDPGRTERDVLLREGLDLENPPSHLLRARGLRRPLRVPVREASLEADSDTSVIVRFVLPPGSFATVLLAAIMG